MGTETSFLFKENASTWNVEETDVKRKDRLNGTIRAVIGLKIGQQTCEWKLVRRILLKEGSTWKGG